MVSGFTILLTLSVISVIFAVAYLMTKLKPLLITARVVGGIVCGIIVVAYFSIPEH